MTPETTQGQRPNDMRRSANVQFRPDRPIEAVTTFVQTWQSNGKRIVERKVRMSLPRVRFLEERERA